MIASRAFILLGAPLPGVRRALKAQGARAVLGTAGKRRVRLFGELEIAPLSARISRARVLELHERDELTSLRVLRAGKQKLETTLPRVLRTAAELERAFELTRALADALDGEPPGSIKPGAATLDLAVAIAGAGASEVRGLSFSQLLRRRDELAQLSPGSSIDPREQSQLEGLQLVEPDGTASSILPTWALREGPKLLARSVTDADHLRARLDALDPAELTQSQRLELQAIAQGALPFPVTPQDREELIAIAKALLG